MKIRDFKVGDDVCIMQPSPKTPIFGRIVKFHNTIRGQKAKIKLRSGDFIERWSNEPAMTASDSPAPPGDVLPNDHEIVAGQCYVADGRVIRPRSDTTVKELKKQFDVEQVGTCDVKPRREQ